MLRYAVSVVIFLTVLVTFLMPSFFTEAGEEAWIQGTILDPHGRPLAGAEVSLRVPQGKCESIGTEHVHGRDVTTEDGRFVLPAPPGEMEIYVRHSEYAPAWTAAQDEAVIELEVASWIEGEVDAPATVTVSHGHWQFVNERVDGRFRCGPLPPDLVLSLFVASDSHRPYLQRVVSQRGKTHTVDVTLARGAALTGRVFPPHEGATIRAHGRDGRECTATTAEDGTFTVNGLEAGWVRLMVFSPDRPVQILDTRTGEAVEVRWPR